MWPNERDRQSAAIQRISELGDGDRLLTPREVAEVFGVRTTTIALWARDGTLAFLPTPGGHRRYRLCDVRALLDGPR
jgi:excisionase family DNA binding protein